MTFARIVLRLVFLVLVFALGTAWYGWWVVPVIAFAYAVMDRAQWHRGWLAAAAAMFSWAGILVFAMSRSFVVWTNSERVAAMLQVQPWMLVAITLLFAALLAGPAAVLGAAIVRQRPRVHA